MPGAERVLVTGGTGFVGSHLVEKLLELGKHVVCLVRSDPKWLDGYNVEIVKGGLERDVLYEAVTSADYVYHVAAQTRGKTWQEFHSANVQGARNLLEAVATNPNAQPRNILITSSLAVVGDATSGIATEETPLAPVSMYGRSKVEMEEMVWEIASENGLPVVVVRPPSVYGPREKDIFTFFQTASKGFGPFIGHGRDPEISLVYVSDLVDGMIAAAETPGTAGGTYFLGPSSQSSWREIIQATELALGRKVRSISVPEFLVQPIGFLSEAAGKLTGKYPPLNIEKAREIVHACKMCSSAKAASDFGYAPSTDIEQGVRDTIDWYRRIGWL